MWQSQLGALVMSCVEEGSKCKLLRCLLILLLSKGHAFVKPDQLSNAETLNGRWHIWYYIVVDAIAEPSLRRKATSICDETSGSATPLDAPGINAPPPIIAKSNHVIFTIQSYLCACSF